MANPPTVVSGYGSAPLALITGGGIAPNYVTTFAGGAIDGFTTQADFLSAPNITTGPWAFANSSWGCLLGNNARSHTASIPFVLMGNYVANTNGWSIYDSGVLSISLPNAYSGPSNNTKKGLACIAWAMTSAGHLITSVDGSTPVDYGTTTFLAPGGSATRVIGSGGAHGGGFWNPSSTWAFLEYIMGTHSLSGATLNNFLQALSSTSLPLTDTALAAWTALGVTGFPLPPLNRYKIPDYFRNNTNGSAPVVDNFNAFRDWNGVTSTMVSGGGSSPTTWTKNGTNPTLVTDPNYYSEQQISQLVNAQVVDSGQPVVSNGLTRFASRSRIVYGTVLAGTFDVSVLMSSDATSIAATDESDKPTIKVDSTVTELEVPMGGGANIPSDAPATHRVWASLEAITTATASHVIEIINPAQGFDAGASKVDGPVIVGVSSPAGQPFTQPTPNKVLVCYGTDQLVGTDMTIPTAYNGEGSLFRADFPTSGGPGEVLIEGQCFDRLNRWFVADPTGQALANRLISLGTRYASATLRTLFIDIGYYEVSVGGSWMSGGFATYLQSVLQAIVTNGSFNNGIFVGEQWQGSMTTINGMIQTACAAVSGVTRIAAATRQAGGVVQSSGQGWSTAATGPNLKLSDKGAMGY